MTVLRIVHKKRKNPKTSPLKKILDASKWREELSIGRRGEGGVIMADMGRGPSILGGRHPKDAVSHFALHLDLSLHSTKFLQSISTPASTKYLYI